MKPSLSLADAADAASAANDLETLAEENFRKAKAALDSARKARVRAEKKFREVHSELMGKTLAELGEIMVNAFGKDACSKGYKIDANDLEEVGRQALAFGDIRKSGKLN